MPFYVMTCHIKYISNFLPDNHLLGSGDIHRVSFCDSKSFEKRSYIFQRNIYPVFPKRVNVACGSQSNFFVSDVLSPKICKVHVECLIRSETVDFGFLRIYIDAFLFLRVKKSGVCNS